jgi:eukaryotic-like serine/threonine-protein kinase
MEAALPAAARGMDRPCFVSSVTDDLGESLVEVRVFSRWRQTEERARIWARLPEARAVVTKGTGKGSGTAAALFRASVAAQPWTSAPAGRGDSTISMESASATAGVTGPESLAVGARLGGRYRILRFIARGAVGEVYAAYDEELGTSVALKVLRAERCEDGLTLTRFRREVLLTRALAHPGVCRVFDLGVHDADDGRRLLFLTMELLAGDTLAQRLQRSGRLDAAAGLALAEKLASALAAAHAVGIIHRDLKPANIILVADERAPGGERVVITDFGLARRIPLGTRTGTVTVRGGRETDAGSAGGGGEGEGRAESCLGSGDGGDVRATATGALVGSPAYMSPEQVAGHDLGPAADIYSLGVVLFEAMTGRLPFEGESLLAMVASRLERDAPAARSVRPDLDPRWDAALARCLIRDPAGRFARVEDVPRAVAAAIELRRPRRWRRAVAAAVAATVGVAVGAAMLIGPMVRRDQVAPAIAAAAQVASAELAPRVLVLPLRNLSGREETSWLADAVAEILATEVSGPIADDDELDYQLAGSVIAIGPASAPRVRVELRLLEIDGGAVVARVGGGGAEEDLFAIASQLGAEIRKRMASPELSARRTWKSAIVMSAETRDGSR